MLRRLLLLFSMLVLSLTVQAGPVALYISPKGNDAGDGSKYHPFLTLERARDVIRAIKQHGALPTGGVTVWLRGGVYARTQSFTLTTEDSGTASAPINYRAYGKESVVLTGGKRIANWTPVTDQAVLARLGSGAQGKVLQADLQALGITDFGKLTSRGFSRPISPAHLELYCNNERMVLARWPNDGFSKIAAVPKADGTREVNPQATGNLQQGFFYADDRPARWQSLDDIWVHGYWMYDWANSYEQLATLDTKTHLITTKKPCGIYGFRPNQRIYFVNVLEELDTPGEYYLDRKTGLLYFWPPTPVQQADCDVTLLEQPLISLHDTSFVSFQRLTVEYVRGKAIEITGGTHDVIGGCTVRHIGNWAVMVNGGTQHLVVGCDIYDTGDGGISLSGGDRKTLLSADLAAVNNHIHHFGQWSRCYQPAVMVTGVGNRVAHNVIHDGPHNAIQLGGNDHVIEYNEISRVCLETGDVGAFYMGRDWTQRGNIIRYNYFHDTGGVGMGSMAVYLDDCTSGTTVFGNIFYRTTRAAFIGGGCDNVVENNIFVEC
ncbi:MAG TPA: right-handed parallel beta-helix repeat-containing protein, partial [Armatimonadota bacterium]|nr:right-handed parallel beta-helix repeat-containing protein [Armatimonadota bacterium]